MYCGITVGIRDNLPTLAGGFAHGAQGKRDSNLAEILQE